MSLRVQTIDHVTIVSSDLSATRAFYVDLLGMEEIERPAFPFPGLWLQAGQKEIHVNIAGEEAGPAGSDMARGSSAQRGHHIAFVVDDSDRAAEFLAQRGVPIVDGPLSRPDGVRQLYVDDPDGYLVEIFSR